MEFSQINADRNEDKQNGSQLNDITLREDSQADLTEPEPSDACQCKQHACEVVKSFCSHTSLHGLQYVGEKGHIALRFLWALVVLLAFGAAMYHIIQVYAKWEETPAMVTISPRVKDIQEVYFPAITICAPALLTKEFANEFLNKSYQHYNARKKMADLYCAEGGFESPQIGGAVEDYAIWQKNTMMLPCDVIMEDGKYPDNHGMWNSIKRHVNPSQTFRKGAAAKCCTFNGLTDDLLYKNLNTSKNKEATKREGSDRKSVELLTPTGIGIQNAFTYMIQELYCLPASIEFGISIHNPAEAPNVEGDGLIVKPGGEISYTVKPLQTESTDNLKLLKPKERECQYYDDIQLRFFRNYTQWNCHLDCLANLTIKRCDCLPPYLPENDGTLKICKAGTDFACFHKIRSNFKLNGRDTCQCEQSCADLMYLVTAQYVPAEKEEKNMVKFHVYFTEPTFFAYQRSEHLGLTDFLASCGGLLGLFMGFSFISMIEIFYFGIFGMWKAIFGTFVTQVNN